MNSLFLFGIVSFFHHQFLFRRLALRLSLTASSTSSSQSSANKKQNKVKVYIVGAGPGDYDLMTIRARDLLSIADVVIHDRLVVMDRITKDLKRNCKLVNVGKGPTKKRLKQSDLNDIIIQEARILMNSSIENGIIVRLKGGDPFVFGLGGSEILALKENKIDYEVVPGITSAIAVPGLCDIPVTHKGSSKGFLVVSGHVPPALIATTGELEVDSEWDAIPKGFNGGKVITVIVLMCAKNIDKITQFLIENRGWNPSTPASMVESGTTNSQKTIRSTISKLATHAKEFDMKSPSLAVFGEVCNTLHQESPSGDGVFIRTKISNIDGVDSWGIARPANVESTEEDDD